MSARSWVWMLVTAIGATVVVLACTPGFQSDDDDVDEVRVDPTSIDFGVVDVNVSNMETFKVYNDTAGTVTLRSVRVEPDDGTFSIQAGPDDGFPLEASSDKLVNVQFYATGEDLHQSSRKNSIC